MSVYGGLWDFTHCVKVDFGSRGRFCLVPVAVGRISHTLIVKVDTLLRSISDTRSRVSQSTIDVGRISHILPMNLDSDPDGELPDGWQSRVFAAFFALRPHGRECPFFSPR